MSNLLTTYLGAGIAADRPTTPTIAPGTVGLWWNTDTLELDAYDLTNGSWSSAGGGGGASSNLLGVTQLHLAADLSVPGSSWVTPTGWSVDHDPLACYVSGNAYMTAPTGATLVRVGMRTGWSNSPDGSIIGTFGDNSFTTSSPVFVQDIRAFKNETLSSIYGCFEAVTAGDKLYPGYNSSGGGTLSGASGSNFGRPTRVLVEWYSGYPT